MSAVVERIEGVAVIGSGVAALTLAAALHREHYPVQVLEDGAEVVDGGLVLWGGAFAALSRMGLGPALLQAGAHIQRLKIWSARDQLLVDVSSADAPGAVEGVAIRARALFDLLRLACGTVPRYRAGHLLGYGEDEHGVMLTLSGGLNVRALVVVGADGATSPTRRQCLDDGPPLYTGDTLWEGITRADWVVPGALHLFWASYGLRGGAMVVDHDDNVSWWVEAATGPGGPHLDADYPQLRALLSELPAPLAELASNTPELAVTRTDVQARRSEQFSAHGRVTLMGDAFHPVPSSLRTSVSLAVEDGQALAEVLQSEAFPIGAFRGYEQLRAPRLHWANVNLWRLRAFEARFSSTAARVRDAAVRRVQRAVVSGFLSRLLGGLPDAA